MCVPDAHAATTQEALIQREPVVLPIEEMQGEHFHRVTTADGLSQTRVHEIIQDDLGFVYFATQYGVNRYDGYNFKLYVHEPGNDQSAAGTYVNSLFKARDGSIWIGWAQGLDRLDPRTGRFTHYFDRTSGPQSAVTVTHISQDRNGVLWLATGSGLRGFDPASNAVVEYRHADEPGSLPSDEVNWTGEDSRGRLWVGTSKGLSHLDRSSGKVLRTVPIAEPYQIRLFEDRSGRFWIAKATGLGLALFDLERNVVMPYSFYEKEPNSKGVTGVVRIAEDTEGNLWLAAPHYGLLRLDSDRKRFRRYGHRSQDIHSIAQDNVIAVFRDRDGNIWTGLNSAGVNYLGKTSQRFDVFRHVPGDPDSLSMDFVNAILEDRDGTLWIGNQEGLNRIDGGTGRRQIIDLKLGAKPTIISLAQDHAGAIWIGTFAHGLTRYDPKTKAFETFMHDPANKRSLSHNEVHRIFEDRDRNIWVATDNGLDRFDPVARAFIGHKLNSSNRFGQGYLSIAEDASGDLWLGTAWSGLHRFNPKTGKTAISHQKGEGPNGLRDNHVASVLISRAGSLWLGTQNGLQSLNLKTGFLKNYDTRNGMPANAVSCILEDERGNIWMSTTNGLSKLTPATGKFTNYALTDALAGNDLTGWDACSKSHRGKLFFAGFVGAVGFIPATLQEPPLTAPLVLTDFEINGVRPRIGPGQPLEREIAHADRITLSHEQRSFSVSFAALRYGFSNATRYRYRLEGIDNTWHESLSSIRRATYTTLPAGSYNLNIQMATDTGDWQQPGISLAVRVLPPWWSTWWFRAFCALVLALLGWLAVRARIRYVTREVTLQMEARHNERMRIAGDLHDTLLQGLLGASFQISVVQDQLTKDAKARPLLDHVSGLLRQLVDEGRNAVRGLRTGSLDADDLEHAIAKIPGDLQLGSPARFQVTIEGDSRPLLPFARNDVYLIAREAIANGLRHANASTLDVALEYVADGFRLTVRDDGCGFSAEAASGNQRDHFGVAVMNERAQRLGGKLTISSGAGSGTEVVLLVPGRAIYLPLSPHKSSRISP